MKWVDALIDRVTMYRLLLYYLLTLLVVAVGFSAVGMLRYNPWYIISASLILVTTCWLTNKALASVFNALINSESSVLTGLILALIITPQLTGWGIAFLLVAAGLAMASKYVLAIGRKHIFNPAAIAVVLTALGPKQTASWWVGTAMLLPFVIVGGLLLMRKIRRTQMVVTFLVVVTLATAAAARLAHVSVASSLHGMVLTSPIFFLAFVMLTEPLTSPTTRGNQMWYATIVAVLLPPPIHLLNVYSAPEIALVIGNSFAYVVSPKIKLFPVLKEKVKIARDSAEFVFHPGQQVAYQPGQYMEWTLPHERVDSRGDRRYLTLASSPTESDLRIGVKFYNPSSSFKKALLDMDSSGQVVASQVSGDFTLPKDARQKLVFIAGGIGITPFRSMTKYLLDTKDARPVSLLYAAKSPDDIAYRDVFAAAQEQLGFQVTYIYSGDKVETKEPNARLGLITSALISAEVPDYRQRVFYISGTHHMVRAMRAILNDLGLSRHQIKTDFFPGYV